MGYRHGTVVHHREEYVRGEIHTQSTDSFWALLKRGIVGTYHNVSKKYLPLYLAEFQFRYNNRNNPDVFGEAVAGC
jgi:transposase-like protein